MYRPSVHRADQILLPPGMRRCLRAAPLAQREPTRQHQSRPRQSWLFSPPHLAVCAASPASRGPWCPINAAGPPYRYPDTAMPAYLNRLGHAGARSLEFKIEAPDLLQQSGQPCQLVQFHVPGGSCYAQFSLNVEHAVHDRVVAAAAVQVNVERAQQSASAPPAVGWIGSIFAPSGPARLLATHDGRAPMRRAVRRSGPAVPARTLDVSG